jgi:hypothetical protein
MPYRNTDPFAPWNDPMHKNDPFAPHNDPMEKNDPFAPWNQPFGNEDDLNNEQRKAYNLKPKQKERKMNKQRLRVNYDKLIAEEKKHPLCKGRVSHGPDGTDYDCGYGSEVTCDDCRFLFMNRGRGKDPRAKVNNPD